ncbi:MAG: M56 family metallopeptidase [Candidatus Aquilonibacter sp.]
MIDTVLLNGLWQGGLIALIAGVITICVPQRHAATRYAVWFSALIALAVVPVATLWHPEPAITTLPAPLEITATTTTILASHAASAVGIWLIALWLAGVTVCLARLLRSHLRIARIIKAALPAPNLGPNVLTSRDVAYPIAAGLFAPTVILPANVAATLERGDLEAIVRHERAHIARHDILTNLAQRLIEACLFFNPWVYVIGRQLLKEREAACDDWAVNATGEPDRYASCLAQLASGSQPPRTPLLTPSAMGSRRMLVGRIARLLNGKATQLKINYFQLGGTVLSFSLLALLLQNTTGHAAAGTLVASNATPNIPACARDVKPIDARDPDISKADFKPNIEAGVIVAVDSNGRVTGEKLVLSSGSAAIDNDVLNAAKNSTYQAATEIDKSSLSGPRSSITCHPVAGHYYFHIATGPE